MCYEYCLRATSNNKKNRNGAISRFPYPYLSDVQGPVGESTHDRTGIGAVRVLLPPDQSVEALKQVLFQEHVKTDDFQYGHSDSTISPRAPHITPPVNMIKLSMEHIRGFPFQKS